METMSEKAYWDVVHETVNAATVPEADVKTGIKPLIKRLLGKNFLQYIRSYDDYLQWEVLYKKYLPNKPGAKVLEVGSAPGEHLVRLNKSFGYIPYGVEYSDSGAQINRDNFAANNIDPDNVIHADFFSEEFHEKYQGYFDIVISRGFIEHFSDVEQLIDKHINVLAKGGHLIITIPNLLGMNYYFSWFFHKEVIAIHNLEIMRKERFVELLNKDSLSSLFCDYSGTFNFNFYNYNPEKPNSLARHTLDACRKVQLGLNILFRLLLKDRGAESAAFSPQLIYIGINKP